MKSLLFIFTLIFSLTSFAASQSVVQIVNNTEIKFTIKYDEKISSKQLPYVLYKNVSLESDKPIFENTKFNFAYYFLGFHNLCSLLGYNLGHDDNYTSLEKINEPQKVAYVGNYNGEDLNFRFGDAASGWYVLKNLACIN